MDPISGAALSYGVPLIAGAIGGLFKRKKRPVSPAASYQSQAATQLSQVRQQADQARVRDEGYQGAYDRSLARYKARILNPQTYATQDQLVAGGAAADAAYQSESDQSRQAAALARAGVPVGSSSAGAYTGAENQRTADLASMRRALLAQQLQRQDAGYREALGLDQQQAQDAYGRSQASSAQLLEMLRYLMGDQTQQGQIQASRRASDAQLIGQIAATAGGLINQNRNRKGAVV